MGDRLRLGIIGLGNAGARHARNMLDGRVRGADLVAVADPRAEVRAGYPGLRTFDDGRELLRSRSVDAVVLATPHPSHIELSALALAQGCHVLVEKPLGVHKAECERVLALHAGLPAPGRQFGVVHDYRVDARYAFLSRLLGSGELGRVERVVWQATDWYRTEAYYHASPWRGRFGSEGGGVLVNQAPHLLDTLVWLFGMPRRVFASARFGRFHEIEVEDDVTAMLSLESGATALLVLGTGEAPGTNRLEISGDRGRAVLEGGAWTVHRNREPASVHRRRATDGRPLADVERFELPEDRTTAARLLANFVGAIRGEEALVAPAAHAARAVELANAILWSSLEERPIELPIDGAAFARVHEKLVEGAYFRASSRASSALRSR